MKNKFTPSCRFKLIVEKVWKQLVCATQSRFYKSPHFKVLRQQLRDRVSKTLGQLSPMSSPSSLKNYLFPESETLHVLIAITEWSVSIRGSSQIKIPINIKIILCPPIFTRYIHNFLTSLTLSL